MDLWVSKTIWILSLGTWVGKLMILGNCAELMVYLKKGNVNSGDEIYIHSSEIT